MSEIYKKIGNYILLKKGEHFGICDNEGDILLPCEYDSIFYEVGGFIITKNSKSGYIKFQEEIPPHDAYEAISGYPQKSAKQFLPCIYDRIEPTRNGLVLYSMTKNKHYGAKREWYDYKSSKIYKNLHFLRNYGEFDKFLDTDNPNENSKLKKSGEDKYITFPFNTSAEILYEVSLYNGGARYFVCSEELSEEEAERKGYICEYFFLIILPHTHTFTEQKAEIASIFEDFPRLASFWDNEAKKEKEHKEYMKGKIKNGKRNAENI